MRRFFRWFLLLGVLVGIVSGIYFAIASVGAYWQSAIKYRTLPVSLGPVEAVVNSSGTVKPVRSVSVGAFVSGPIKDILVDFNSVVKAEQPMALIDPRLLEAAYERDKASLRTQEAERDRIAALLKQSERNLDRAQKLRLVNKDYLSDSELDQFFYTVESQKAQLKLAEASISQAQANVENSKTNLGYTTIVSPVDGIVIERKVDQGQTVASSFQTPELFVIAVDLDKYVHVFASVDEADIGLIRGAQERKQPVKFTVDAYPEELFEGEIFQIRKNSTTTQNVVTYPVVVAAQNRDLKLMPGMTANISFRIEAKENVLRVPSAALRFFPMAHQVHPSDRHHLDGRTNGEADGPLRLSAADKAAAAKKRQRRLVWVQEGPFLRAVPVTLGLSESQFAEVVEGNLTEGQMVVTGMEN
ncbi:MAG TPA: efflux RND transporter periplasmic adaptor subunit, partial [Gemmataceae bacterium]|nr:efflux RND transporter periplasmic adaptor subunit [Gemmataceae bacterium]